MKYIMYSRRGEPGVCQPGLLHDNGVIDLEYYLRSISVSPSKYESILHLIEFGQTAIDAISDQPEALDSVPEADFISLDHINLIAPLYNAKKLILLAGNYAEHIREVGYKVPPSPQSISPQFFMKPPSTTILDPGADIKLPDNAIWFDWEVELGVVIGVGGKHIDESQAMKHVFGYTIINDISERKFNDDMQDRFVREKDPLFDWLHGKWFDDSAPMGPCVVTKDSIPDPHNLKISLQRNGVVEQNGTTADMIHPIPHLIHKLSQIMTLEIGDVISTGTPAGVGFSKGIQLKNGDELVCKLEGVGELRNKIM